MPLCFALALRGFGGALCLRRLKALFKRREDVDDLAAWGLTRASGLISWPFAFSSIIACGALAVIIFITLRLEIR